MEDGSQTDAGGAKGRLLLIDGHAYAYRAFYAIRSLSSPMGEATNAIFGFIRMLIKAREKVGPQPHPRHLGRRIGGGKNGVAARI